MKVEILRPEQLKVICLKAGFLAGIKERATAKVIHLGPVEVYFPPIAKCAMDGAPGLMRKVEKIEIPISISRVRVEVW
jgi:hypothetical protein